MSLNTSSTPDGRGVLIYNGEIILVFSPEVNVEFENVSGGEVAFKGKKKGQLYLTSHRVIFISKNVLDPMKSFAMPFACMKGVKLEQPVFGANYLRGNVQAQPGGNWSGDATIKLTFSNGGCIEFGEAMLNAQHLAHLRFAYAAPPAYVAPAGNYFQPPPAYYTSSGADFYGFVPPTNVFPQRPDAGNVYMYEVPPPYSGIGPSPPPYSAPTNTGWFGGEGQTQQNQRSGPAQPEKVGEPNQPSPTVNGTRSADKLPTYDEVTRRPA